MGNNVQAEATVCEDGAGKRATVAELYRDGLLLVDVLERLTAARGVADLAGGAS